MKNTSKILCLYIFGLFVIFALPSLAANEGSTELIPLKKYMDINGAQFLSDPPTFQYALERCTAIYSAMVGVFNNETASDRLQVQSQLKAKADKFGMYAINIASAQKKVTTGDRTAGLRNDIVMLLHIYVERIKDARLRLGDFWEDKIVAEDYEVCEGINLYIDGLKK
jgi:hypothetical protein